MKPNTDELMLCAQETLDALFRERLIPFELTAYEVNAANLGEYIVAFYDARIHSVRFSLTHGDSVNDVVRSAVLERTSKMSGPLKNWKSRHQDMEFLATI